MSQQHSVRCAFCIISPNNLTISSNDTGVSQIKYHPVGTLLRKPLLSDYKAFPLPKFEGPIQHLVIL